MSKPETDTVPDDNDSNDNGDSKTCDRCGGKGFVVDRGFERICGACGGLGYEPV